MRRLLSIAFVAIFLLFSGGVQILVHTCGTETTVHMMPSSAEDPCGCGKEAPDDGCCTLVLKSFHLDAMQHSVSAPLVKTEAAGAIEIPLSTPLPAASVPVRTLLAGASPPQAISPTILHCSFLL